jgi:hypothetical protein
MVRLEVRNLFIQTLNTWQQHPSEQDFALDKLFFFTADTLLEGLALNL